MSNKLQIIEVAKTLGFADVKFVKPKILAEQKMQLLHWLSLNYHAEMHYLTRNIDIKINPNLAFDNLKTIAVFAYKYPANVIFNTKFKTAKYATVPDYHKTIKNKLKELAKILLAQNIKSCHFVDSGAVLEKQWAILAGIGWQGKNGLIINESLGSFFHIGIMFLDIEIEPDLPVKSSCGACNLCIKSCPTGAILQPSVLDCRKCLSCYTIEKHTENNSLLDAMIAKTGTAFGCDICQNVCPHNKNRLAEPAIYYNFENEIVNYTEDDFKQTFAKSPIKRAGFEQFIGNVKLILRNE